MTREVRGHPFHTLDHTHLDQTSLVSVMSSLPHLVRHGMGPGPGMGPGYREMGPGLGEMWPGRGGMGSGPGGMGPSGPYWHSFNYGPLRPGLNMGSMAPPMGPYQPGPPPPHMKQISIPFQWTRYFTCSLPSPHAPNNPASSEFRTALAGTSPTSHDDGTSHAGTSTWNGTGTRTPPSHDGTTALGTWL